MAFESKISLLNQIEKRIGADVSFDTMPKIMSAISDILFVTTRLSTNNVTVQNAGNPFCGKVGEAECQIWIK